MVKAGYRYRRSSSLFLTCIFYLMMYSFLGDEPASSGVGTGKGKAGTWYKHNY
jgi:hypothetical protein